MDGNLDEWILYYFGTFFYNSEFTLSRFVNLVIIKIEIFNFIHVKIIHMS